MRKSSKVLALILTLALLCGALAVAAFATEEEIESVTPVVDVSNEEGTIVLHGSTDFEGTSFKMHRSGRQGTVPTGAGSTAVASKSHAHFDSRDYMGNTYAAFWYDKNEENAVDNTVGHDTYHDLYLGTGYASEADSTAEKLTANTVGTTSALVSNDYIVIDWDFSADKYLVNGEFTDTWTEGATLSYTPYFSMSFSVRGGGNIDKNFGMGSSSIKLSKDGDRYYIYNSADASQKAYLSEKIGEWNHVTVVIEVNNKIDITIDGQYYPGIKFMEAVKIAVESGLSEADAKSYVINNAKNYQMFNSELHMFLNGDHFSSVKYLTDMTESMGDNPYFIRTVSGTDYYISPAHFYAYNIRMGDGNRTDTNYSIGLDNVATHYYRSGYADTAEGSRTLDEYMTSGSYETRNLAFCSDVVYNGNYKVPNPNTYVASVKIEEETKSYYTKAGAEDALVEGATLILAEGTKFENFIATFKFLVQTSNPENFVIRNSSEYSLVPTSEANIYAVKPASEIGSIPYFVFDCSFDEWDAQSAIEEGFVYEGSAPALYDESKFTRPTIYEKNPAAKDGVFVRFDGWDMYYKVTEEDKDKEGVIYDEEWEEYWCLTPTSMLTSEIVKNNSNGIYLFPRYVESQYAFSVINAETGVLVDGYDYSGKAPVGTVVNEITATKGAYIVTLYTDIETKFSVNGATNIVVGDGVKVYFDLNGNDYIYNNDSRTLKADGVSYNDVKTSSFSLTEGGELHIYSTKEGGRAFNFSYVNSSKPKGGSLISYQGSSNKNKAPKLYLGAVDETVGVVTVKAEGNNLWTSSGLLVEAGKSVAYKDVYEIVNDLPVDKNGDGKIGIADKKANATTYYSELYIDGGTYTRPNADGGGVIKTNAYLQVEVKNATILGSNIFATDSRYNPLITGTVHNSVLNANNGTIFGQFCDGSTLTMTDTVLLGALNFTRCTNYAEGTPMSDNALYGEVYLGEGCKISGEATDRIIPVSGMSIVDLKETYREDAFWYAPSFTIVDGSHGTLNAASINTKVDLTRTYDIVKGYTAKSDNATINWISAGNTIETMVVPVVGPKIYAYGLIPTVETSTAVEGTKYFKLGIDHWTKDGKELPISFAATAGETVNLIAVMGGVVPPEKTALPPVLQFFELEAKYTGNIYAPCFDASEIEVDGVTYKISASTWSQGNGKAMAKPFKYNGGTYTAASTTYSSAYNLNNGAHILTLTYTVTKVEEGKEDVTETFTFTYSGATLAQYFMKAFEAAKDDAERTLLANAMQYSILYYEYQRDVREGAGLTDGYTASYNSLITFIRENQAKYTAAVTDISTDAFNAKVAKSAARTGAIPAELADYISSITFYNNGGVLTLCVVPVKNIRTLEEGDTINLAPAMSLRTSYFGTNAMNINLYIDVWSNSSNSNGKYVEYHDAKGNVISGQNWSASTGYYNNVNQHLAVAVATNVLYIDVTTVEKVGEEFVENTYTIEYSLADYVVAFENSEVENEARTAELVKAFLAYGESAVNYLRAK